jgi:hypothetical protein
VFLLVNSTFASKLQGLNGYEIVLILDDSGSMSLELSELFSFLPVTLTTSFIFKMMLLVHIIKHRLDVSILSP